MPRFNIQMSAEVAELAEEVISENRDLEWIRTSGVSIGYLTSEQVKRKSSGYVFAECYLVKPIQQPYCPHDFLIIVYLPNIAGMTREQLKILLYHELLHVSTDGKSGEPMFRIRPHDVEDFREIITRYGPDWSARR